mgnify:CR=1 FL=1
MRPDRGILTIGKAAFGSNQDSAGAGTDRVRKRLATAFIAEIERSFGWPFDAKYQQSPWERAPGGSLFDTKKKIRPQNGYGSVRRREKQ